MSHHTAISHAELKQAVEVASVGRMAQAVKAGASYFAGHIQNVKTWLAGKDQVNKLMADLGSSQQTFEMHFGPLRQTVTDLRARFSMPSEAAPWPAYTIDKVTYFRMNHGSMHPAAKQVEECVEQLRAFDRGLFDPEQGDKLQRASQDLRLYATFEMETAKWMALAVLGTCRDMAVADVEPERRRRGVELVTMTVAALEEQQKQLSPMTTVREDVLTSARFSAYWSCLIDILVAEVLHLRWQFAQEHEALELLNTANQKHSSLFDRLKHGTCEWLAPDGKSEDTRWIDTVRLCSSEYIYFVNILDSNKKKRDADIAPRKASAFKDLIDVLGTRPCLRQATMSSAGMPKTFPTWLHSGPNSCPVTNRRHMQNSTLQHDRSRHMLISGVPGRTAGRAIANLSLP